MSVMAKAISGKRINYAQRGSYARRAYSAVMAFDHGAFWLPRVFSSDAQSPIWQSTATYFIKAKLKSKPKKPKSGPFQSQRMPKLKPNQDYGPNAVQGRMISSELDTAKILLIQSLQKSVEERAQIERQTVGQGFNELWKYERRNRITASNCGRIYSLQASTSNTSILKTLLYPTDLSNNENVKNGINLEPEAKRMYSFLNGVDVQECGLFISLENGVLAASPDGLIGEDGLLEVKCTTCPPDEVPRRSDKFLVFIDPKNPETGLCLKRNHKYFYQILMQLHVTQRSYCDLFVYHKPKDGSAIIWHQERILRNQETEQLWIKVKTKLIEFYEQEMAPEICDPVFQNSGCFRVPEIRRSAIELRLDKKNKKMQKSESHVQIPITGCDTVVLAIEDQNGSVVICEELLDI